MSTQYLGEVRILGFSFAPKGWAQCNGQILPISQNQALFSILGTSYGGDGRATFGLPDFRGRLPLHTGTTNPTPGTYGGEESHKLTAGEIPAHTHVAQGSITAGNSQYIATTFPNAQQNIPASVAGGLYGPSSKGATTLHPSSISTAGSSQPHENRQPFAVLNFCIALQGVYPSRN